VFGYAKIGFGTLFLYSSDTRVGLDTEHSGQDVDLTFGITMNNTSFPVLEKTGDVVTVNSLSRSPAWLK